MSPAPVTLPVASPLNLHVVVTESILNRIVARQDTDQGEVQDVFEGTPVAGRQVTASRLAVDLRPSSDTGRILIVLEGETSSTTEGFSPQAIINSVGRQQFRATKEVLFDGYHLATRHAVVSARAESQNVGAVTKFTGRPLGPLVEQVVLGMAQHRQPAAEEFARQRVVERVYPRFDGDIDAQLGNGNRLLKDRLQSRLKAVQLFPDRVRVRSTDTHLHLAASVAVPLEVSEFAPAPDRLVEPHEISIYLHESLLQGVIERAELAGRKTTVRELIRRLRLVGLAEDTSSGDLKELDVDIEFAEVDPLQIEVGDEETRVTLRAAFHPAGQKLLPQFAVTIPFRMATVGEDWQLRAGPVQVRSVEEGATGNSLAEITVQKLIEASLPNPKFPQQLPVAFWPADKTPPKITSIHSAAGWLVLGVD